MSCGETDANSWNNLGHSEPDLRPHYGELWNYHMYAVPTMSRSQCTLVFTGTKLAYERAY